MTDIDETLAACRLFIREQIAARQSFAKIGKRLGLSKQMTRLAQNPDWNPLASTVRDLAWRLAQAGYRPDPDALAAEIDLAADRILEPPDPRQMSLIEAAEDA